MKKALVILCTLLMAAFAAKAADRHRIITFEELPVKAQEFVTTYFSGQTIRFVEMEIEVKRTEYTVRFENGMEIEFNSNGDWEEVESHAECLPTGFLNENILNYLSKNFPNCCIREISKSRFKVEIELDNGLELVFNKNGDFLRFDD